MHRCLCVHARTHSVHLSFLIKCSSVCWGRLFRFNFLLGLISLLSHEPLCLRAHLPQYERNNLSKGTKGGFALILDVIYASIFKNDNKHTTAVAGIIFFFSQHYSFPAHCCKSSPVIRVWHTLWKSLQHRHEDKNTTTPGKSMLCHCVFSPIKVPGPTHSSDLFPVTITGRFVHLWSSTLLESQMLQLCRMDRARMLVSRLLHSIQYKDLINANELKRGKYSTIIQSSHLLRFSLIATCPDVL